jgi:hypothetical protein
MNARDDSALGQFWVEALGWSLSSEEPDVTNLEPVGFTYPDPDPDPVAVCIDILASPQPETVKTACTPTSPPPRWPIGRPWSRLKDLGDARRGRPGQRPVDRPADLEGDEFCVLELRSIYRDTGPIAAVVDCSDPQAMAWFWGKAMGWTLHDVTDDHALLRSAEGVSRYLEFLHTPEAKTVKNLVHLDLRL